MNKLKTLFCLAFAALCSSVYGDTSGFIEGVSGPAGRMTAQNDSEWLGTLLLVSKHTCANDEAVRLFGEPLLRDEIAGLWEEYERNCRYARLLMTEERFLEAADVCKEALILADRLRSVGPDILIADVGNGPGSERLDSHKKTCVMIFAAFFAAFLSLFFIFFFYSRSLRNRNRILSEQLGEIARLRAWQMSHLAVPEDKVQSGDPGRDRRRRNEEMIRIACREMIENKRFREPSLNRRQLADLLGTNENYLAAAIREVNDGQTVSEFINCFRFDYACRLITERPDMTLDAVAHECGLVTRSTLFRLFIKKLGMSPGKYRAQQLGR